MVILLCTECLAMTSVTAESAVEGCAVRFQDNGVCACSTKNPKGPVKCDNNSQTIEIQPCYCAFYDQQLNKTIVGHCYYTCYEHSNVKVEVTNSDEFNDDFCDSDTRRGFFCYQCKSNYSMAVFSNLLIDCVPCQYHWYKNWFLFFAVALLPLTLFYILAVLLSFNITSSSFGGIVLVLQCIMSSPLRTYLYTFTGYPGSDDRNIFVKIFFSVLECVNLNFVFFLYSPVCLHPKINVFEIECLDYIIALHPFLLIIITYLLVNAYDRQFKLLHWMWRPFRACILRYRKTWNIHTSLIEIFASFILLSSVKIVSASLRLLSFVVTYDLTGKKVDVIASMSVNVKYFRSYHLPFALLAMAISFIFVFIPLLLLTIYPCRCFQRCLNCCKLRSRTTLHIFMDAFQGSYKTRPYDMRYFSAFYLFLRVLMLTHAEIFLSQLTLYTSGIISLVSAALIAFFQPYKVSAHNKIDSALLLLMGIYFLSCNETILVTSSHQSQKWIFPSILQGLSIILIVLYFILLVLWKLLHKKMSSAISKIRSCVAEHKITGSNDKHNMIESFVNDRESAYDPPDHDVQSSTPLLAGQILRTTY